MNHAKLNSEILANIFRCEYVVEAKYDLVSICDFSKNGKVHRFHMKNISWENLWIHDRQVINHIMNVLGTL